jgi:hypothetical protein
MTDILSFILATVEPLFQLLIFALHVSLAGQQFALEGGSHSGHLLLLISLSLPDLLHKLFFLKSKSLPFELHLLQLLSVFLCQLAEVQFPLSKFVSLSLILFVNAHDLLHVSLHSLQFSSKLAVSSA